MKIREKIEAKRMRFINDMEATQMEADELQIDIAAAIRAGIGSREWRKVMLNFADNPAQLARLMGADAMSDTVWGENILAYIVANGLCTMGSTFDTFLNMDADMIESLDRDLPDNVEPISDPDDDSDNG